MYMYVEQKKLYMCMYVHVHVHVYTNDLLGERVNLRRLHNAVPSAVSPLSPTAPLFKR